jgi:hypothetical protein
MFYDFGGRHRHVVAKTVASKMQDGDQQDQNSSDNYERFHPPWRARK